MDGIGRVESGTETESDARLKGFRRYDPRDGGGRAKHDYRDIGGRVTPGAVTEEARAENESGDRVEEAKAEHIFQTESRSQSE